MSITIKNFNNKRYASHAALESENNFFLDKVYLFKTAREIDKVFAKTNAKILEIGCADGSFSKLLMKRGYNVVGIDIAEEAVKAACVNGVEAQVMNVEEGLGFNDETFDAVIACEVIEHLYDTDFFIKEILRVLKKGGYIFLSTPNLASLQNRLLLMLGRYPKYSEYKIDDSSAGHIRNYTTRIIAKQLNDNGATVERIMAPNFWCPMTKNLPQIIKNIAIKLGDVFYNIGSHMVVVAKK
ncbi:MAG: class I SAM-dependent methyltransferase [Candidatus Falkowbacteria bacterium]|nr:class I SAM-dependent methyltransferase [Candidatus Falkowbacteria bacterium]